MNSSHGLMFYIGSGILLLEVLLEVRGCSHIMSAAGGGEGVSQKMTIADEGG